MLIVFGAATGLYCLACLLLYVFQEKLIFHPPPAFPFEVAGAEPVDLPVDGALLRGLLVNPGRSRLLVYFGGNAEDVTMSSSTLPELGEYTVLLLNYRGYGCSTGRPGQQELVTDAVSALDAMMERFRIAPERVVLFGRSLGSGVAVQVAARRPVAGLVLVTPFDSLYRVAANRYPIFPVRWLLRHPFDSEACARKIHAPCLVLTAENDTIVPPVHSQRLAAAWRGPVMQVTIPASDHNNLHQNPAYGAAILAFLKNLSDSDESMLPTADLTDEPR